MLQQSTSLSNSLLQATRAPSNSVKACIVTTLFNAQECHDPDFWGFSVRDIAVACGNAIWQASISVTTNGCGRCWSKDKNRGLMFRPVSRIQGQHFMIRSAYGFGP